MSVTLLITTRSSSHPYSVASSTVTYTGRQPAEAAKAKIEREHNQYNSGIQTVVLILEGTA